MKLNRLNSIIFKGIRTKFMGPTNTRGSRIKAIAEGGLSVVVEYRHDLNSEDNHLYAARKLQEKYGWSGDHLVQGSSDSDNGYFFVQVPKACLGGAQ